VCARFNAKNSFGAYTGIQEIALSFEKGKIVGQYHGSSCKPASFSPFVGLENLEK
jgi:hypothetical protein